MKTAVIIIAVTLAFSLVVCGGGALFLKSWFDKNGEALKQEGERAQKDAVSFAAAHSQEECIGEAVARMNCPDDKLFMCNVMANVFLSACLKAATPTPAFCDGVATGFSPLKQRQYGQEKCAKYGRKDDQMCEQMIAKAVPQYCVSAKSARP